MLAAGEPQTQRSHLLLVLSDTTADEAGYQAWLQTEWMYSVGDLEGLLSAHHYRQHAFDITHGQFPRFPFRYLSLCELAVDGAQACAGPIDHIVGLHRRRDAALAPATWIYYPACERVGRPVSHTASLLTLAFANGLPGRELEFKEWYATRHIRHALKIPQLISGQCFERTLFQMPGALDANYSMIAIYAQDGSPEDLYASLATLPEEWFTFPSLDISRFVESVYERF